MKPVPRTAPVTLMQSTSTLAEATTTLATSAMVRARSRSIGFSSSFSASMVSKRWLRRSSILFFTGLPPDAAVERAEQLYGPGERLRQVVHGVARHQLAARDER